MSTFRQHRRRSESDGVSLNLAAMLDMAFQLLTFFILTFRPAPLEAQVQLRLPPPKPVTGATVQQPPDTNPKPLNPMAPVQTLVISAAGNERGLIASLTVGDVEFRGNLGGFEARVHGLLADAAQPFEQVLIQVGSHLRYDELMRVVDVCSRAKLPNGERLAKLSFTELPSNP